jgi:hypothetical protein
LHAVSTQSAIDEAKKHIFWMCGSRRYVQVQVLLLLIRCVVYLTVRRD